MTFYQILDLKGLRILNLTNSRLLWLVKFSESVNSVHYFSILPYGLNDRAVQKKLLGEVKIKGDNYYKIEITFSKENGGVDYDDIFIYWIKKENFKIGFVAYKYNYKWWRYAF